MLVEPGWNATYAMLAGGHHFVNGVMPTEPVHVYPAGGPLAGPGRRDYAIVWSVIM